MSRHRGTVGLAIGAMLLPLCLPVGTVSVAHATTDARPVLDVTYPYEGARVGGSGLTLRGTVGLRDPGVDEGLVRTRVQYVVDVSGSTSSPLQDCNGDGVRNLLDDFNGDGRSGDVLDCQIAAVVALNASLRSVLGSADLIEVGLTAFGTDAATAQMERDEPGAVFVAPGLTEDGKDVTPNVNVVASSLREGRIGEYVPRSVGTGTNFDAAISAAPDALGSGDAPRWVFFLSDGQAAVSPAALDRVRNSGVGVRTFAVGNGTGAAPCAASAPLGQIATAGSDSCVRVTDPSALKVSLVDSRPAWVERVWVDVGGRVSEAEVDAIGGWTAAVAGLADGAHEAVVSAKFADGTVRRTSLTFWITSQFSYTALGDSFASGEGMKPYLHPNGVPGASIEDYVCHRSVDGWPRLVSVPGGDPSPIAQRADARLDFGACTGARIVNFDTERQTQPLPQLWTDEGRDSRLSAPLQLDRLASGADLVTVSIGGNDLGFAPIVTHCIVNSRCWERAFVTTAAGTKVSLHDWTTIRLALVGGELTGVYTAIRSRVGPDTTVVATTYPRLVSSNLIGIGNSVCHPLALEIAERHWLRARVDVFADIVRERAGRGDAGLHVVDVRDDFEGRNVCDPNGYLQGAMVRTVGEHELFWTMSSSFHPNERGAALYAAAMNDHLRDTVEGPHDAPRVGREETSAVAPDVATVIRATGAFSSTAFHATASSTSLESAPAIDPGVIDDPDEVLAEFPLDVVDAVGSTTFADVGFGNGPGMDGGDSCDDVVSGEIVPFAARGFSPGSEVTVEATSRPLGDGGEPDGDATRSSTHVADEHGDVVGRVVVPPFDVPGLFFVTVTGTNAAGGTAIGHAIADSTDDPDCRRLVEQAGYLLVDESTPVRGVPPGEQQAPEERDTANSSAASGAAALSTTGTPIRWLLVSVAGLLVSGGTALLIRWGRRERGVVSR